MKYIKTEEATIERLDKARKNLTYGSIICYLLFILCYIAYALFYVIYSAYEDIFFLGIVMFLICTVAFVLKREIYSLAILIKQKEK